MILALFLATNVRAAATNGVTDEVKKTVDEVVRIVSDKELKKNDHKRRQMLKKSISVIFDYNEMAKRSLGKHWNQRSPAERKQFAELFPLGSKTPMPARSNPITTRRSST